MTTKRRGLRDLRRSMKRMALESMDEIFGPPGAADDAWYDPALNYEWRGEEVQAEMLRYYAKVRKAIEKIEMKPRGGRRRSRSQR